MNTTYRVIETPHLGDKRTRTYLSEADALADYTERLSGYGSDLEPWDRWCLDNGRDADAMLPEDIWEYAGRDLRSLEREDVSQ